MGIVATVRTVNDKVKLLESTGTKNCAQELGSIHTADKEQETALKLFKHEKIKNDQEVRKAKDPARINCDADVGIFTTEPDSCLSVAGGMWWENNDFLLGHTDEDWGQSLPDDIWYYDEVDHMTRGRHYFKPPHLDQLEASGNDKEAEKHKQKLLEEEVVLK